jgi:cytosine/adenosine deaminase-related metal-dependent hydrolase
VVSVSAVITIVGLPLLATVLRRHYESDPDAWERIYAQAILLFVAAGIGYLFFASYVRDGETEVLKALAALSAACCVGWMIGSVWQAVNKQLEKERAAALEEKGDEPRP